ncbi:MAG: bifunctional hydroxymethylpyrimidine kinase/phosphomethylpyrimidine kinase [Rhodocyclaceae bacterium]|nr:bifunctional hydroxymethylpyrimidine kinase/phosphomethylpyrimidine kinase [Rhodocyclaceae bacterium]
MAVFPPPVLVFDGSDPTGAAGLQGAALTLAARGCLPLSVATAIYCGDTRGLEHVYELDAEWVAEQARPLLEDIPVAALLVGDPGCPDSVGVIAEIAADYSAPLVFAPGSLRDSPDPDEADDLVVASIELLLPQTAVLVVDGTVAMRIVAAGDDDGDCGSAHEAARLLLGCGAERVLLADGRDAAMQSTDLLIGPDGVIRKDPRRWPQMPVSGSLSVLAAAVAAGLAQGLDCMQAVGEAHRYLAATLASPVRPGMGAAQADRFAASRGGS